ncbi:MAG: BPL-N domain-containing protein [Kiritimatiellae bacterium]|nr:BPL-N domain-containing protein [Kiritimatiellia bacterium]
MDMTRLSFTGLLGALFVAVGCGGLSAEIPSDPPVDPSVVRVAVFTDKGARSMGAFRHLQIATFAKNVHGFPVDGKMVAEGALNKADVLIMPGGSSGAEAKAMGPEGVKKLEAFIRNGGGYIGTCAGCFLVSQNDKSHSTMMGLIPYKNSVSGGGADMLIRFTKDAETMMGIKPHTHRVDYHNGPVMVPAKPVEGADFKVIATYYSDVNANEKPRETMAGKAAIVAGSYGKGRIVAIGPHPEKDVGDHSILKGALRYVTHGRAGEWTLPHRKPGQLAVGVVADNAFSAQTARFAQKLMRLGEFELQPLCASLIEEESARTVDVMLVPPCAEKSTSKGGLGSNRNVTRGFLKRGGRVIVWGEMAPHYAKLGDGVTVVQNEEEALAALRARAKEPAPAPRPAVKKVEKPVKVAYYTDRGGGSYPIAELLANAPEYQLDIVNAEDIRNGALKNADLVVMPGGLSNVQYNNLGALGREAITNFVNQGGKYYGICAGAYLASQTVTSKSLRLSMVPFKHDGESYRGWKSTRIKLTDEGRKVFGTKAKSRIVEYWGGPVLVPGTPIPNTDVKTLATYTASSISTCSPDARKPMTGKTAFAAGTVGKGKVFISSCHPECYDHSIDLVQGILAYLTGVKPTWSPRQRQLGDYVVGYESHKDRDFARWFTKDLMHAPGFFAWDMHDRHVPTDLLSLDALLVINPKRDYFGPLVTGFIASGRPVIAIARTPEQVKAVEGLKGVTVVRSYEEVLPALKKFKAAATH